MNTESNPNAVTFGLEAYPEFPKSDSPIYDSLNADTYWNGDLLEIPAERVKVIVAWCEPEWWCSDHIGEVRDAVKVTYRGEVSYIDNKGNLGWLKVTVGKGSPRYESRAVPVESEVI